MSLGHDLADLYGRELDRLEKEIRAYADEAELWTVQGQQKNPPGTMAMHLVGNLRYYIGAELGGTGYVRDRDFEFTGRQSREAILADIASCRDVVTRTLAGMSDAQMQEQFPGVPPGRMEGIRTQPFLLHLLWHLGWHLGHIYYHRLGTSD